VLALALGALLRSSAAAVTVAVVVIVLPYLMVNALPGLPAGVSGWLLRITPAAGFAVQQSLPRYPQVIAGYTPGNGYYPLAPWAGFAVLCGYAAVAVVLAVIRLGRTDA
jgi:ABC-type transport system involved in multi-copper enzyme maturation permease subunit